MATFLRRFVEWLRDGAVQHDKEAADTFVEATGGGWVEQEGSLPADGGDNRDYVSDQLKKARRLALKNGLEVGDSFEYTLEDIPKGISSPHAIAFGVMMQASKFGFYPGVMRDETIVLTVTKSPRESL